MKRARRESMSILWSWNLNLQLLSQYSERSLTPYETELKT